MNTSIKDDTGVGGEIVAAPETSGTSQIFLTWLIPHSLRHFTARNWQCVVVGLTYRPLPSCSRASVMPQQGLLPEACPVPIHVQPERNYGEIPSLSFAWADVSMASPTVVFRRFCWISCQLPIAMASLETDSYLGLLSLPILLPVADWAIGLNSSLVFSSFFIFTFMLVLLVGRLYFSTLWFFNLAIWLGLARGFWWAGHT